MYERYRGRRPRHTKYECRGRSPRPKYELHLLGIQVSSAKHSTQMRTSIVCVIGWVLTEATASGEAGITGVTNEAL